MKKLLFLGILLGAAGPSHAAQRWIVYTATQTAGVNCSSYLNGGKLVMAGADAYCADDAGTALQVFNGTTFVSSPTARITFSTNTFSVSAVTTSTASVTMNSSSVTLQGNAFNSASQLVKLDSSTKLPAVDGSQVTSLVAANISAGSLGGSVIASSIAVNAVQDASIVGVGGAKITGTGTIPNAAIDSSSVTKQGNTFNGNNQLLKLGSTALVPNANIDASSVTLMGQSIPAEKIAAGSLGSSVLASSIAVNAVQDASVVGVSASKLTGTGTLPNAVVDGSSVTKQGNTFNGASQLLKLDANTSFALTNSTITTFNTTTLKNGGVTTLTNSSAGVAILGSNTNDTASAGNYGEYISSAILVSSNTGASGTGYNIASITLTAGDWDVSGVVAYFRNSATFTSTLLYMAVTATSGNSFTGENEGDNAYQIRDVVPTTFTDITMSIPSFRVSLSATTTYYLKGFITSYSAGQPKHTGRISARRAR